MKFAVLLLLICATCVAQDTAAPSCPLLPSVGATNAPLRDGAHIVVWFENQGSKAVQDARVELAVIDGKGKAYFSSRSYDLGSRVNPGQAGLLVRSAREELDHFGTRWQGTRGLEARIIQIIFADGSRWEPANSAACQRIFSNANYEREMRLWNRHLRANWNRMHPDEPMPEPSLAAWLRPEFDGWQ